MGRGWVCPPKSEIDFRAAPSPEDRRRSLASLNSTQDPFRNPRRFKPGVFCCARLKANWCALAVPRWCALAELVRSGIAKLVRSGRTCMVRSGRT